ncbi:MAG: Carbon-nitrogen hydrolase [Watsoniomyces obsoletus]|nr:MAG: Carbon-nitrogen hydrolase [Watsoniomyces obsoletus]
MTACLKTMPSMLNDSLASSQGAPNAPDGEASPALRSSGVTFAAQERLPTLPIPELEDTCRRYLGALKALQSAREHETTGAAVEDFLQNDGPELQERLRRYASGKSSYIEQFWYDSYLNFDNPVVLNLNPFFLLEDDPTPARNDQVTRAASLVVSALAFARAIRKEELPPDTLKGTPLDMYQYSRIFGTSRIPTENGCVIGQDPEAKHIVVLCRGQFYWFDVLDDNSDTIMTEKDMAVNLRVIVEDAEKTPVQEAARGALGVLSTENRKIWASLRDVLTREEGSNNADCLGIVDCALFILCLDDTEPQTSHDLCMNMLCGTNIIEKGVQVGTCTNRWYDKLQIIVCKNGSAGINFEHTGVDGHTVLRMASDVYTDTILRFARTITGQAPSLWASTSPDPSKRDPSSFGDVSTTPHKLEWDMQPELRTALRFAETRLADLIQQNEFRTLEFQGYGKSFMTSMGFSPDAFVQMAFQAAYYGLYGRLECTYEPAMTKVFLHGRTEAIRTVTPECVDFVRTFWAEHPAEMKVEALRKACRRHTEMTKECAKAQGQDRHLFALLSVWQRSGDDDDSDDRNDGDNKIRTRSMPSIFADPGWSKLNNTILSTSNCGNPSLRHFGFGPVSSEGFGIGYIIKEDGVSICASSKHRQTKRYMDGLEAYFLEMRRLLRVTTRGGRRDQKTSRAREVDDAVVRDGGGDGMAESMETIRTTKSGRWNRGRRIEKKPGTTKKKMDGEIQSRNGNEDEDDEEDDDDGLGGYGFFDAGMLLQALKGGGGGVNNSSSSIINGHPQHQNEHQHDENDDNNDETKTQNKNTGKGENGDEGGKQTSMNPEQKEEKGAGESKDVETTNGRMNTSNTKRNVGKKLVLGDGDY